MKNVLAFFISQRQKAENRGQMTECGSGKAEVENQTVVSSKRRHGKITNLVSIKMVFNGQVLVNGKA